MAGSRSILPVCKKVSLNLTSTLNDVSMTVDGRVAIIKNTTKFFKAHNSDLKLFIITTFYRLSLKKNHDVSEAAFVSVFR